MGCLGGRGREVDMTAGYGKVFGFGILVLWLALMAGVGVDQPSLGDLDGG